MNIGLGVESPPARIEIITDTRFGRFYCVHIGKGMYTYPGGHIYNLNELLAIVRVFGWALQEMS